MFTCQECGVTVPAGTRAQRFVVETRVVHHPARVKANTVKVQGKDKHRDDPGGTGTQIVREVLLCPACATEKTT